ncbi:MAG: hypothetical protein M3367_04120 [Acidobacteriota bacterium]|nr:hypothetical protein [Acidobacteriota bacterium]
MIRLIFSILWLSFPAAFVFGQTPPTIQADFTVKQTRYLLRSQTGFTAFQFGFASDIPAPADYDGDGKADAAVYRDGIWYLRQSASGFSGVQFGLTNDTPIPTAYLP